MYLRITQRRNRDGSTVAYYALAENVWNAAAKRSEAQVVHNFGRADQVDRAALQRLVNSINRVLNEGEAVASTSPAIPEIEVKRLGPANATVTNQQVEVLSLIGAVDAAAGRRTGRRPIHRRRLG